MNLQGMNWKEIIAGLTKDFLAWGCPFSRRKLPEIALGYDCPELFFWNWMDGEESRTETGFLRVLGYAWRKYLAEAGEKTPQKRKANTETGIPGRKAA